MMVTCRSTKSASKARRDLINSEIQKLRALLPIRSEERERLSYLHAMSIICTFIRKSALLHTGGLNDADYASGADPVPLSEDLLKILNGFIVAMTSEGKLVYVSENVSQYLGLSMVDILQGDTFYSMIHNDDHENVRTSLQNNTINTGTTHLYTHYTWLPLLVTLRMFDPQNQLIIALCSPTPSQSTSFITTHTLDMRYTNTEDSVVLQLGYNAEELIGRSWYSIIHPDDLMHSVRAHTQLIHGNRVEMVVRLQNKQMNWVWNYIIAFKEAHTIVCTNYIISNVEAEYLREKLCSSTISPSSSSSPPLSQSLPPTPPPSSAVLYRTCNFPNPPIGGTTHEERGTNTLYASCPPYSPTFSLSPTTQDVNALHILPHSSSFCTPQSFTYHTFSPDSAHPTSPTSDSSHPTSPTLDPASLSSDFAYQSSNSAPLSSGSTYHSPHPASFSPDSTLMSPSSYYYLSDHSHSPHVPDIHAELPVSSSDCLFHQDITMSPTGSDAVHYGLSDVLTVPPAPIQGYSEREKEVISVLARQISSLANSFSSYCTKSSAHHPGHTLICQSHDTEAFLLDEQVINSVLQVSQSSSEVQALDSLLDFEMCSSEEHQTQPAFNLHPHYLQDGFTDQSMY
ncbi:neuronal PAS domain-containing protein 4-like [Trichomycterus rosablanca]|uniref:neuronal PAS domain-containing protein 4-like n=1 Tax=Trichomycterus rosablanca TaxID=2290929 RepID=UPI002F351803